MLQHVQQTFKFLEVKQAFFLTEGATLKVPVWHALVVPILSFLSFDTYIEVQPRETPSALYACIICAYHSGSALSEVDTEHTGHDITASHKQGTMGSHETVIQLKNHIWKGRNTYSHIHHSVL